MLTRILMNFMVDDLTETRSIWIARNGILNWDFPMVKDSSDGALNCHIMLNKVLANVDRSHAIRITWQFCSNDLLTLRLHSLKCEGRLLTMPSSDIACEPSLRILDKRWFRNIKKIQIWSIFLLVATVLAETAACTCLMCSVALLVDDLLILMRVCLA